MLIVLTIFELVVNLEVSGYAKRGKSPDYLCPTG